MQLSQVAFLCCLCHSEDDRTKNLNTSAQLLCLRLQILHCVQDDRDRQDAGA